MDSMLMRNPGLARAVALLLVAFSALGAAGWLGWCAVERSEIGFLPRRSPAEWIVCLPAPNTSKHPRLEIGTTFRRSFVLDQPVPHATFRIAAYHRYTAALNGAPLCAAPQ